MKKMIILVSWALALAVPLAGFVTPAYAMNKAELVEAIASDAGLTMADTSSALDAFISVTTTSLKSGERVALVGFGSFSISKRTIGAGQITEILKSVKFKAGDMPFLPNVEYTTTEDIIKYITEVGTSGEATKRGLTEDQARQFMDSFTNVIIDILKTGESVNIGEDFGTFSIPRIGHVDHGKDVPLIGDKLQKVVKFKAGADLAKSVA